MVDVSYGGENGFNQAIELASETLSNVKFIQEKKLLNKYFDEVSQISHQDAGKVCYGIGDTLKALELGACETLIVFENLDLTRWALKDSAGAEVIVHTSKADEANRSLFVDKETGQEMEVKGEMSFLEWLAEKVPRLRSVARVCLGPVLGRQPIPSRYAEACDQTAQR